MLSPVTQSINQTNKARQGKTVQDQTWVLPQDLNEKAVGNQLTLPSIIDRPINM